MSRPEHTSTEHPLLLLRGPLRTAFQPGHRARPSVLQPRSSLSPPGYTHTKEVAAHHFPIMERHACRMRRGGSVRVAMSASTEDPASLAPTPMDRLRTSLPFLTDPSLLCEDVVYVSPLHSSVGRESYFQLFEHWARAMPERLQDLEIRDVQVYQLKPREVSAKWTYRFVAPLPLPARVPGRLPADLQVLPGDKVLVDVGIMSTIQMNENGQVVSQVDRLAQGGSGYMYKSSNVAGTVARFEFLMAQRLQGELLWVYYWRVLREQTRNEAQEIIDIEGGMFNERSFEKDFRNMIMRQFAVGGLLGALLYYCLKYFNFFLMTHPPS